MSIENMDQINSILEAFQPSSLYCLELRKQLISDALPGEVPSSIVEMELDEKLLGRLDYDLSSYQTYLSAVEFNWIEAVAKELFITNALLTSDTSLTADEEVQRLSAMNAEYETQLQQLSTRIEKDEESILGLTQALESDYDKTIMISNQGRKLMNEISDLELELNELKINQPDDLADQMTIEEVTQATSSYEGQLQDLNERLATNQKILPQLKLIHSTEIKTLEQLKVQRHNLEKAEGDRRRTLSSQLRGGTLVKIEAGLTWFRSVRSTYEASMGILSISLSGPPRSKPNRLYIRFSLRHPLEGTLVIEFKDSSPISGHRRISSAYLDQSSQDIEPIVKPYVEDNDLVTLIRAVVHFMGRL